MKPLTPRGQFALTPGEIAHCDRLFRHLEDRIAALSRENEQPQHDLVQTSLKRGQILMCRELLKLATPNRTEEFPPRA